MLIVCSACSTRLKVGENLLGKRVKCPSCGEPIVVAEAETERVVEPEESAITETPRAKVKPTFEEVDDDSAEDDSVDDRPRKKKKKKKRRGKPNPAWAFVTAESMPTFLFGGGAVLVIELVLLGAAFLFPAHHPSKYFAAYLFAMLPISTLIFFLSMYLSSLMGAFEIGEIPIAMIKGFFLIFIVDIVSLIPFGFLLTALVWFGGVMTLFRLDVWEARVLIAINWVLNLIASVLIVLLLANLMSIAREVDFHDDDLLADEAMIWDADDIRMLGGRVGFVDGKEEEVSSIVLANCPIHDAHLVHMKDFPRLARLDLSNTPITNRGLPH